MQQNLNLKKTFLITMIVALSIGALIGIFIFLFGELGTTEIRLLLTTLAVGGYSLTGLCCSALYEKKRIIPLALSGMVVSILGFVYTVLVIWEIIKLDDWNSFKPLLIFIILTFSTAHSCLLLLIQSEKALVKYALFATLGFIVIVAVNLILRVLEIVEPSDFKFKLLAVFIILDVLGTIVTPILHKVYSK